MNISRFGKWAVAIAAGIGSIIGAAKSLHDVAEHLNGWHVLLTLSLLVLVVLGIDRAVEYVNHRFSTLNAAIETGLTKARESAGAFHGTAMQMLELAEKRLNDRIETLEDSINALLPSPASKTAHDEIQLPTVRPKIVPVRWGKTLDETGLIVRNDSEPAFSISIDGPVAIGEGTLDFRNTIYPGLTQSQGELLIEARIRLGNGTLTGGGALRDLMVQAKLDAVPLLIRYHDFEDREYSTNCEVVKEFLDDGLVVRLRRKENSHSTLSRPA